MRRHVSGRRPPPALILSSRAGLTRRYGPRGFLRIHALLRELSDGIEGAALVYVDDECTLGALGATPVSPRKPEAIHGLIERLEASLSPRLPAAVWLIGGHDVIPFFRLANPAEDPDGDLLSDAPYAGRAGDPFNPLRPVGRLPDIHTEGASLASLLARALPQAVQPAPADGASRGGYSASLWREAAQEVFSSLAPPGELRMSPPWDARDYYQLRLAGARIKYYNLHGKPDGLVWYGQRDPLMAADYPNFPVALRQSDISAPEARGAAVVTEACYGAALEPRSIAGRFLHLGAAVYLGAMAMAYGAIAPPVSGADVLAKEFLRHLLAGHAAGEAHMLAKLAFTRTMMAEQGFLDSEDQKTVLSFVLLGNPLTRLTHSPAGHIDGGTVEELRQPESVPVVCARSVHDPRPLHLQSSLLDELESYASAFMVPETPLAGSSRQGTCIQLPNCEHSRWSHGGGQVLSIRQTLSTGALRLARFTLAQGRIAKAVVSR